MISSLPPSSSRPAGTQTQGRPRSGLGTGEPHTEQKSERKPEGLTQDEISASPRIHRKLLSAAIVAALADEPLWRRHREQWHWYSLKSVPATSNSTCAHRQWPRMVFLSPLHEKAHGVPNKYAV